MSARAAGGFLGGITNNPGIVIILVILGIVLIFSKDIAKGIGGLKFPSFEFPDINLPDITFPSFDIDFPSFDFEFPSFDFSNIFGDLKFPDAVLTEEGEVAVLPLTQPGEGGVNPADMPTNPTEIDIALSEGATPGEIAEIIGLPSIDPNLFQPPSVEPKVITPFGIDITPFLGLGEPKAVDAVPLADPISELNIGQEQPGSFILGGQTLSTIIQMFDVSHLQLQ